MEKKEMLYEGKAKQVYATENAGEVVVRFKDDATAFNAQKKGQVDRKGELNNAITTLIFTLILLIGPQVENFKSALRLVRFDEQRIVNIIEKINVSKKDCKVRVKTFKTEGTEGTEDPPPPHALTQRHAASKHLTRTTVRKARLLRSGPG